jgi:hypothetical protein
MNSDNLEGLWVNLMNRSIEMLKTYINPEKVNQEHLAPTILSSPEKLALIRQVEPAYQNTAYIACILTDACTVLDIIHAQHMNTPIDNQLSKQCVELLCDLIK